MSQRISVTKLVKGTIGTLLLPLGYEYNYKGGVWEHKKDIVNSVGESVTQMIWIQAHTYSDVLSLELFTDAYGRSPYPFSKTVDGKRISAFHYVNEEDVADILTMFADYLRVEGLERITELSEPVTPEHPENSDCTAFLEQKEKWAQRFSECEPDAPRDDLVALANWVCEKITVRKGRPFHEVKQYLLDLMAYYTLEIGKYCNISWNLNKEISPRWHWLLMSSPSTRYVIAPVNDVFFAWLGDGKQTERHILNYIDRIVK